MKTTLAALACAPLLMLGACSSSPPVQLYQLRAEPPSTAIPKTAPDPRLARWALGPVLLPDYLDRDAIVRPQGQAGLGTLPGQRWAEPLRDAVPRLLLQDLARLRGSEQVWRTPLPPGVSVDRQLRVDLQRLDADETGSQVVLLARWMLVEPRGQAPAQVRELRIEVPVQGAGTDALVAAHRAALWALAQTIDQAAR